MRGDKPKSIALAADALEDIPAVPSWFGQYAKAEWKRAGAALVARRVLTQDNLALLESYCINYQQFRDCVVAIRKSGLTVKSKTSAPRPNPAITLRNEAMKEMRLLASELGLSPVRRDKVSLIGNENDDDFAGMDIG